ncbi:hypothetical protein ACKFKG_26830 [Phormidesmis sp. 146-35]
MDLKVYPCQFAGGTDENPAPLFDFLSADRDYDLFSEVSNLAGSPLWVSLEHEERDEDMYGEPLVSVCASGLSETFLRSESEYNQAIGAYLKALAPETQIVLFWC